MRGFTIVAVVILASCLSCKSKDSGADSKEDTLALSTTAIIKTSQSTNKASTECASSNEVQSLGIGLVSVPVKFEIYNDSLLTDRLMARDMYLEQDSLGDVCTKFFDPEYADMDFVCLGQTKLSYIVLMNYSQVKYLPKRKEYEYQSWEEYIVNSHGVRRRSLEGEEGGIDPEAGFLRQRADENSDTVAIPAGFEMFCAMEVKGDWVKVRFDCFYNLEDDPFEGEPCHDFIEKCKNPVTGWLKWRRGNKLLLDIMTRP